MALDAAVVGAGTISGVHLTGISKNPRTNLVGICDVNEQQAIDAANEHGIKPYFDVDDMLEEQSLDLLHVCTPVQTHLEISKKAIAAGVPLLIEKPITETVDELETIEELSEEHGVPVSPVNNHLFDPVVLTAREMIDSGELGRIRGVDLVFTGLTRPDEVNRGSWVFDLLGGEFEEGLPHSIYLTLGLGGHPKSQSDISVTTALNGEYEQSFEYDSVQVQYVTPDEALCSMKMTAGGRPQRMIHIHGEEKTITIDILLQMSQIIDSDYNRSSITKTMQALRYATGHVTGIAKNARLVLETSRADDWDTVKKGTPHFQQFDRTAKALENGSEMPVPLASAKWTIQTMHEIRKAASDRAEEPSMTMH